MTASHASAEPPRVEDERLLTGRGQFVSDLRLPGMLHARFLRSPYPRARIASIDAQAARAMPGVVAVFTADDLPALAMPPVNPLVPGMTPPPRAAWSAREVDHVGQPVAMVVAERELDALDAAEAIGVDWEPRDVDDADAATGESGGRQPVLSIAYDAGDFGMIAGRPARSAHARMTQPRVAAVAMEPRGAIADWRDGRLCAWLGVQAVSRSRDDLADLLGLPRQAVRVIAPDVGGAFGARSSLCPEEVLVAAASRALGRPVKWLSTRSEDFQSGFHGRGATLSGELLVGDDGGLLGLRAELEFPLGAWLGYSAAVPARNAARMLPGPYRIDAVSVRARAHLGFDAPVTIYRGAGRPEAVWLTERLIDEAAALVGVDPVEMRRRHVWPVGEMPARLPNGDAIDSADFAELLERACARFDYEGARRRQRERRAHGELTGIGVALYAEPCGAGWEGARVTLEADGGVLVASGSTAQGQGHLTSFATIAAEELGCRFERVRVVHGDTDACPPGIGALASRSIAIGGSAVVQAAREARTRRDAGEAPPVTAEVRYTAAAETWASGCVIAEVRVDPLTGEPAIERIVWVDDAGRVISPRLAEGQLIGGLAQGIGQSMSERIVYDEFGQLLTGSLMDYAMPRAEDIPGVTLEKFATPIPGAARSNLLGAKGVGEAGCIGVPAALSNAFHDALAPLGVRRLDFPFTAARLWEAMRAARTPAGDHG